MIIGMIGMIIGILLGYLFISLDVGDTIRFHQLHGLLENPLMASSRISQLAMFRCQWALISPHYITVISQLWLIFDPNDPIVNHYQQFLTIITLEQT
jgi:ABC-type lipoprotein release transport system permease subunit